MSTFEAAYIKTFNAGLFKKKIDTAYKMLKACNLCPRKCGVNQLSGETGICNTGKNALVSSYKAHIGEEDPLV